MSESSVASTPEPPYFAVIFTSIRAAGEDDGYAQTAERMVDLARTIPGFLGIETVRDTGGVGITVSYWKSEEAIRQWQQHAEHREAQRLGRERWYERYELRVCRVERAYGLRPGTAESAPG